MSSLESLAASRVRLTADLQQVTDQLKAGCLSKLASGQSVSSVAREAQVSRQTLYEWIEGSKHGV